MRATLALLAANFSFFIIQSLAPGFTEALWLVPSEALAGAYWQFVTYMFLHGGIDHILFNMISLGFIGLSLEAGIGARRLLELYLASGLGSAVLYIALTGASQSPMLGASGAVLGLLAAYGVMNPRGIILIMGFPVPAALGVVVFAAAQFVLGFYSLEPGVANFGHFGGIVTGAIIALLWRWRRGSLHMPQKGRRNPSVDERKLFWEDAKWQKSGRQTFFKRRF